MARDILGAFTGSQTAESEALKVSLIPSEIHLQQPPTTTPTSTTSTSMVDNTQQQVPDTTITLVENGKSAKEHTNGTATTMSSQESSQHDTPTDDPNNKNGLGSIKPECQQPAPSISLALRRINTQTNKSNATSKDEKRSLRSHDRETNSVTRSKLIFDFDNYSESRTRFFFYFFSVLVLISSSPRVH